MRGCFNSVIASLILADDNLQEGCHEIPRKFGTGQICVCDSNLCNSATSLKMGAIPSKFSIFGIVKHDSLQRLYFAGFIFIAFMQRIILKITWIQSEAFLRPTFELILRQNYTKSVHSFSHDQ